MGTFPATAESPSRRYRFSFRSASLTPDAAPPLIRIQNLLLHIPPPEGAKPPAPQEAREDDKETESVQSVRGSNSINTNLDLREGQKVVVGRSNLDGRSALVLVLTVRVLE